ncbi:MAG: hypothetical protein Tsb005_08780 [Gammaproteobacteria bacterium]
MHLQENNYCGSVLIFTLMVLLILQSMMLFSFNVLQVIIQENRFYHASQRMQQYALHTLSSIEQRLMTPNVFRQCRYNALSTAYWLQRPHEWWLAGPVCHSQEDDFASDFVIESLPQEACSGVLLYRLNLYARMKALPIRQFYQSYYAASRTPENGCAPVSTQLKGQLTWRRLH